MTYFGDAEAAACAIIRADPTVAGYAATVTADLIGYATNDRWVRVTRTGGLPTLWMQLDNAIVTVDAYAEDKVAALDLARAARGALFAATGVYSGYGLAVYDVADSEGLAWAPQDTAPTHYTFAVVLVTRPI